ERLARGAASTAAGGRRAAARRRRRGRRRGLGRGLLRHRADRRLGPRGDGPLAPAAGEDEHAGGEDHRPDAHQRASLLKRLCCEPVKETSQTGAAKLQSKRPLQGDRSTMKRKAYGRDAGLTLRMLFTSGLLGLLYVAFALVLFYVLNAGIGLMIVIVIGLAFFQYFTSDKLALAASGAKIVERH